MTDTTTTAPDAGPSRPDVTRAQILAGLVAGVPIVTNLLAAFGVFTPTPAEQHAITEAMKWAAAFAGVLVAADAHLRGKRNDAHRPTAVRLGAALAPGAPAGQMEVRLRTAGNGEDTAAAPAERALAGVAAADLDAARADEVDLEDPSLDDPSFGAAGSGIPQGDLEHHSHLALPGDVAERDARMGRATPDAQVEGGPQA